MAYKQVVKSTETFTIMREDSSNMKSKMDLASIIYTPVKTYKDIKEARAYIRACKDNNLNSDIAWLIKSDYFSLTLIK